MNDQLVFRLLLLLLLVVFIGHRGYYTRKYGRPDTDVIRARGRSAGAKLAGVINLSALVVTVIYLAAPWLLSWAGLPFPNWLRWAGGGIAVIGFALLQWAHLTLSRNWSDNPRLLGDQVLVTDGPYRRVRHPIYTAFLLILSAPLFLSANWLVGLLWIISTAFEVASRVRFEEALLADHFGDYYRDYMASTGQLLPRLKSTSEHLS